MKKMDDKAIRCSFCGKSADQVGRIISGRTAYICNECVELCYDILDTEAESYASEHTAKHKAQQERQRI